MATIQNTNKWDTRTMVTMALLAAIAALLSFIEGGNFGGFLDYDASFVPAVIGGFIYGPVPGVVIGVVSWIIHGLIKADFWGAIMNIACVIAYVLPAAILYKKVGEMKGAAIGLVVGSICAVIVMIGCNMIVTPIYTGLPTDVIAGMIVPLLLPFNAAKAVVNSILAFALFKPVANMVLTDKQKNA